MLHVDTGHNFPEVIDFRDRDRRAPRPALEVALRAGLHRRRPTCRSAPTAPATRCRRCRCSTRSQPASHDAVFGGARRDEDKARAKERILSLRDEFGQWDPRNQRPELWNLYNGRHTVGQHVRAFPISQLDRARRLALHRAREHRAAAALLRARARGLSPATACGARSARSRQPRADEDVERQAPSATAPSATCAAPAPSNRMPPTVRDVVVEVAASTLTERGATRADDRISEAAMEDRKKDGYF